jgi:hypothetical protein
MHCAGAQGCRSIAAAMGKLRLDESAARIAAPGRKWKASGHSGRHPRKAGEEDEPGRAARSSEPGLATFSASRCRTNRSNR